LLLMSSHNNTDPPTNKSNTNSTDTTKQPQEQKVEKDSSKKDDSTTADSDDDVDVEEIEKTMEKKAGEKGSSESKKNETSSEIPHEKDQVAKSAPDDSKEDISKAALVSKIDKRKKRAVEIARDLSKRKAARLKQRISRPLTLSSTSIVDHPSVKTDIPIAISSSSIDVEKMTAIQSTELAENNKEPGMGMSRELGSVCPHCQTPFSSANEMIAHAIDEHNAKIESVDLRCFKGADLVHVTAVEPSAQCRFCNAPSPSPTSFFMHTIMQHRGQLFPVSAELDRFVLMVSLGFANQSVNISIAVRRRRPSDGLETEKTRVK